MRQVLPQVWRGLQYDSLVSGCLSLSNMHGSNVPALLKPVLNKERK